MALDKSEVEKIAQLAKDKRIDGITDLINTTIYKLENLK